MRGHGRRSAEVIPLGLEPKTHSLEGCCSIQLSYGTMPFSAEPESYAKVRKIPGLQRDLPLKCCRTEGDQRMATVWIALYSLSTAVENEPSRTLSVTVPVVVWMDSWTTPLLILLTCSISG